MWRGLESENALVATKRPGEAMVGTFMSRIRLVLAPRQSSASS
jgi:hypothetical protein